MSNYKGWCVWNVVLFHRTGTRSRANRHTHTHTLCNKTNMFTFSAGTFERLGYRLTCTLSHTHTLTLPLPPFHEHIQQHPPHGNAGHPSTDTSPRPQGKLVYTMGKSELNVLYVGMRCSFPPLPFPFDCECVAFSPQSYRDSPGTFLHSFWAHRLIILLT